MRTHMEDLGITIGGAVFAHLLFHFVLTYSNVEAITVCGKWEACLRSISGESGCQACRNGWATQQALHDQIALLHFFEQMCGQPARTIAWRTSMIGMMTAGLIQF